MNKIASRNPAGDPLNHRSALQVSRVDRPQSISAADKINAPRIKNTAWLPNKANASALERIFSNGSKIMASIEVICNGIKPVTHRQAHKVNTPITRCASTGSPSGEGP